jgi:hypothetical protein
MGQFQHDRMNERWLKLRNGYKFRNKKKPHTSDFVRLLRKIVKKFKR